jgi:tryptophan 2,3-dioxygenase
VQIWEVEFGQGLEDAGFETGAYATDERDEMERRFQDCTETPACFALVVALQTREIIDVEGATIEYDIGK